MHDRKHSSLRNLVLASITLSLLTGCANQPLWVKHRKEADKPIPTRYEAPFNQDRESSSEEAPPEQTVQLPRPSDREPQVIEPEPWVPGRSPILFGIAIKDKPGFVLSPYAPQAGLVDVRGFPENTDVRDPYTGKVMKVPAPVDPKAEKTGPKETTLSSNPADKPAGNNEPNGEPTIEEDEPPVLEP